MFGVGHGLKETADAVCVVEGRSKCLLLLLMMRTDRHTDRHTEVKTVYPPVSLRSLGGYNKDKT